MTGEHVDSKVISDQARFFFRFFIGSPLEKTVFLYNIIKVALCIACTELDMNTTVF